LRFKGQEFLFDKRHPPRDNSIAVSNSNSNNNNNNNNNNNKTWDDQIKQLIETKKTSYKNG
jgi:hypothetical protein